MLEKLKTKNLMIKKILSILYTLANFLEKLSAKHEQKDAQKSRDQLEDDPAKWYDNHFSGLRNDESKDADKTDDKRDREK